jgi:hemoglobin-like flavoprotein
MDIDEIFHESYQRCNIDNEFLEDFLCDFCDKNPRFQERFSQVDIESQAKMLKASIILIYNAKGNAAVRSTVTNLAFRHKEMNLSISEYEFDLWVDSLISTVATHDPIFNRSIENAWRETLKSGLAIMKQVSCDNRGG